MYNALIKTFTVAWLQISTAKTHRSM